MFSVPCSETQLNLNIKKITKYCYDLKKTDSGRNVSNRDGWQSTELFFPNSLSNLADKICEVGSKIFYALDGSEKYTINLKNILSENSVLIHPVCTVSTFLAVPLVPPAFQSSVTALLAVPLVVSNSVFGVSKHCCSFHLPIISPFIN